MNVNHSFRLIPLPPFRLDYTDLALRRRTKNIMDRWDGRCYSRVFVIENKPVNVMVVQLKDLHNPEILVTTNESIDNTTQAKITAFLEMMFALKHDFRNFYHMATNDAQFNPLVTQFLGLKPPRFPSLFEALVNAVSCQQISLDAGLHIQNRFIQHFGRSIREQNEVFYAFPGADVVSECSLSELKGIGYSTHKGEALIRLASAIQQDQAVFSHLESQTNESVMHFLRQFKGVWRWTAEYVLLRGLGRIEILPGDDVVAQNNLQKLLHLEVKPDYKKVADLTASWSPYAGFVYFHLLLQKLHEKGVI